MVSSYAWRVARYRDLVTSSRDERKETLQRLNDNLIDVIRTKETLHRSGDKFSNNKDRAKPVKNITCVIHIHRTIYKNHMDISGSRISLIDSTSRFVKNIVSPYVFPTGQRYRFNESLNITQYGWNNKEHRKQGSLAVQTSCSKYYQTFT